MNSDKYTIYITDEAQADLDEILNYIAVELCNIEAAKQLVADIDVGIRQISSFPNSMPCLKSIEFHELRRIDIKNFTMVYDVKESKHEVFILSIFYARSDIFAKLLRRL